MNFYAVLASLILILIPLVGGEFSRALFERVKDWIGWVNRQNSFTKNILVMLIALAFNAVAAWLTSVTGVVAPEPIQNPDQITADRLVWTISTFLTWAAATLRHLSLKKASVSDLQSESKPPRIVA